MICHSGISRVTALVFVAGALQFAQALGQGDIPSPVQVQPSPTAIAQAKSGTPPAKAQKKATAAGGKETGVKTTDAAQDTDSFWVEETDFDGDGNRETTQLVWDDESRVLFLGEDGSFTCRNGATASGEMLMGIYGDGNAAGKPAGSGFYVAALDAGECGVKTSGLIGCRFDPTGKLTECGTATLDQDSGAIVITRYK
jgi:hypothetical protein